MSEERDHKKRKYPDFYEHIIPIALSILAVLVLLMILFSIAVGAGILHFG